MAQWSNSVASRQDFPAPPLGLAGRFATTARRDKALFRAGSDIGRVYYGPA